MKYLKQPRPKSKSSINKVSKTVCEIVNNIRKDGDTAVNFYNEKFDKFRRDSYMISKEEIEMAYSNVDSSLIDAIKFASENIRNFAQAQLSSIKTIENLEITKGVFLNQKIIPVDSVLCYVPGGRYPLLSSALMLAIPAIVSGVKRVVATTPVVKGTSYIHPATLVAMDIAGVKEIYALGGVQAIASFAYGTETINPVDLIVGPGNEFVAEAKRQVFGKVGIDFIAGPSEVLIIADDKANPDYIASDLLAQSEHDVEARGILVTNSKKFANKVTKSLENQLSDLPTSEVARLAWENNGTIILVKDFQEAVDVSNSIAPEHLEIMVSEDSIDMDKLVNYGSLFIGDYSAEVFGDYVTGTNHTLPTSSASRYTGGLSVFNFIKILTTQKVTSLGVDNLVNAAEVIAESEGLIAHKNAATIRRNK